MGPMRKRWSLLAALLVIGIVAVPALAGNNGKGLGKGKNATVAAASTLTLDQANPRYGDAVTFTLTNDPAPDGSSIWLACYQNGQMVFQVSSGKDSYFLLKGGNWNGDIAAQCNAKAYYYVYQGQTAVDMVWVAETGTFDVGA